jgi:GNAT superfamily N-acetyltransferase
MSAPERQGRGEAGPPVTSGESVRDAVPEDGTRIAELGRELIASLTPRRGGTRLVEELPDGVREGGAVDQLLGDPSTGVLVGMLDGVIVGFAVCRRDAEGVTGRGTLDACYVEEQARGVGVGQLLLETALSWLGSHGCEEVDGLALPGDRAAKNFYESAGFKARLLIMNRSLDRPS